MQFTLSDEMFLDNINLKQDKFGAVNVLMKEGQMGKAALLCTEIIFSKPFKHVLLESDIPLLVKHIVVKYPHAIDKLKVLLKFYKTQPAFINFRCHALNVCARLYHLTGNRQYLEKMSYEINQVPKIAPNLPDAVLPGMFAWHPGQEDFSDHHFNYGISEIIGVLPLIRDLLKAEDRLQLLKNILVMTEFSYRSTQEDVVYNHPLGYISAVCAASCSFPDFKSSEIWYTWSSEKLHTDCIKYPTYTEDGYSREGFGYQEVNARHLLRAVRAMKYSDYLLPKTVNELCKLSFTFYVDVLQNNGHYPLIGDSRPRTLEFMNIWHQASVFYRLPALKFMNPVEQSDESMEDLCWVIGLKGIQWWENQNRPKLSEKVQKPCDLRNSGFQISGFGKGAKAHYAMLCYGLSHNHAHFDVGSINISGFGKSLISDPGKATYKQPYYENECSDRNHNLSCLIRRKPMGPRIDSRSFAKTIYVHHKKTYQASAMQHTLYENHTYKRALIGVPLADSKAGVNSNVIWFVYDQIKLRRPADGNASNPFEFVDTYFHFNAPETDLGIDRASLTCWSQHSSTKKTLNVFGGNDVNLEGKSTQVDMRACLKAMHLSPSKGNLQITAIPYGVEGVRTDLRQEHSSTLEYGERVKRPAINFQYRGPLPFNALFVLVPFEGLRKSPVATVTGSFNGHQEVAVNVILGKRNIAFSGSKLLSKNPVIRLR